VTLLTARGIRKSFAGVRALRGVSFDLLPGEVHALVGENGAGKSTLIRVMTGAVTPDEGTLAVGGVPIEAMTPAAARRLGVAAIYQQPALFPDLTVAENISLGLEPAALLSRIDWRARTRRAHALLGRLGAAIDPATLAGDLTMPEQQIVEIAKALGAEARVVIMDEPTASLSKREVDRLFEIIGRLRSEDVGIVYISHRLDEVMAVADRVTVLRDGETVATHARGDFDEAALVSMMVGRAWSAVFPKRPAARSEIVLTVRDLTTADDACVGISFEIRRGEILGLAGLVGSGRTALAESLFGLRQIARGEVRLGNRVVRIDSPAGAAALGIAYLAEDRRHSLVGQLSVAANASLATLERIAPRGLIDRPEEDRRARTFVDRLQIKTPGVATPVEQLSGGNQQKVALARWLAASPQVIVLDEPTQGVDVGAKAEIHALMQQLVEEGLAVLMISSDLPEVLAMSDRVAVMRGGRLSGILSREEATEERVLALALAAPVAAEPR
jgi:rhamnose transport system ATP-binding protein